MAADRTDPAAGPRPPSRDTDDLVRAFQAGTDREDSFRRLYQAFAGPLNRFFGRKGLRPDDCLDLTQETFLGIYNGLDGFRWEARFETWLYRIANTSYLKRIRAGSTAKRKGFEVSTDDVNAQEIALRVADDQLAGVLHDERRRALRRAVGGLPDQMRKCLTLRIYHELAYSEIAEVLRIKIDTVKAHLFQARKKLQTSLDEDFLLDFEL